MAKQRHVDDDRDKGVPNEDVPAEGGGGTPDGGPGPKFGSQEKADPGGPVPRVIKETERAPAGFTRFKIECRNYLPQPRRYVLANKDDEAGARAFYLETGGLKKRLESMAANGIEKDKIVQPEMVVTKLPD